jgi:hypothetical protein
MRVGGNPVAVHQRSEHRPRVDPHHEAAEPEPPQRLGRREDRLRVRQRRLRPEDVHVALEELAEAPAAGAVGPPDRPDLVAPERALAPEVALGDVARERHGQVVAQREVGVAVGRLGAALRDLEDQLLVLAVLPGQQVEPLERRRLERLERERLEDVLHDRDRGVAAAQLVAEEVARAGGW